MRRLVGPFIIFILPPSGLAHLSSLPRFQPCHKWACSSHFNVPWRRHKVPEQSRQWHLQLLASLDIRTYRTDTMTIQPDRSRERDDPTPRAHSLPLCTVPELILALKLRFLPQVISGQLKIVRRCISHGTPEIHKAIAPTKRTGQSFGSLIVGTAGFDIWRFLPVSVILKIRCQAWQELLLGGVERSYKV